MMLQELFSIITFLLFCVLPLFLLVWLVIALIRRFSHH